LASNQIAMINFLNPVQELLPRVEERMLSQADQSYPDLSAALGHLLSSGGKRVRPAVALLTGGMLYADNEKLITLAAALELLHTATLVHDDLIDGALLRRGIATLNASWSPAATVLTGDFIFAKAAKLAAETGSVTVMQLFAQALATIVNGEITQLFSSRGLVSREDYYQRIYAKTASLFEICSTCAAVLSPVDENMIELARVFGYDIGMAFQIVDDILDFTGEQVTVGKPVASDLRHGLITLPALYYFEENPDDSEMKAILKGNRNDTQLDRLVISIRSSGAIERSMDEARQYIDHSINVLEKMPDCPERKALEALADYIVQRKS
jgi:geranylgeranyl pyrophosphate synthase